MRESAARVESRALNDIAKQSEPFDALDRMTSAELDAWWARRLSAIYKVAARELPFYRERFAAAGFDATRFRSLADLKKVPITRKSDLLAAQRRIGSNAIGIERVSEPSKDHVTLSLSSGTSGTTFVTHNRRWRRMQGLSSSRGHWWAGLRPGGPLLMSAPAWHSYASIQPNVAMHFEMPCVIISGTYLPRFADRIVDAIQRFRPRFVTMFLPMVFSILAEARRQGLGEELFAGIESMVVTGAPITPGMRMHLQKLTKIPRIAEIAGSSENLLAVDCPFDRGLHLVFDTCHAEVLDRQTNEPVADNVRGAMVHSMVIPYGSIYLRYDGGDVGYIDHAPCPCGVPSPRIKLLGRAEDEFTLGSQAMLPYDVQLALETEVPELGGATCVITREGLAAGMLRLLLIESESSSATLVSAAREKLVHRFGVQVEIAPVRDLPLRFKGVPPILSEREASAPS